MALPLADKIKPKNNGTFALVDAKDVEMPDGTRLDEALENFAVGVPEVSTGGAEQANIQPDQYYVFGQVNGLRLNLIDVNDGNLHEYQFEFIPTATFSGLTITPGVSWYADPLFETGKVHQVSIMRGVGVMICA